MSREIHITCLGPNTPTANRDGRWQPLLPKSAGLGQSLRPHGRHMAGRQHIAEPPRVSFPGDMRNTGHTLRSGDFSNDQYAALPEGIIHPSDPWFALLHQPRACACE